MSLRIERRGKTQALICACCNLPFARLQFGKLVVQSKHYSDSHTNGLTLDDLKKILAALEGEDDIMREVHERASA